MPKAGKIKFVPPDDPIDSAGRLRIELLDDGDNPIGELDVQADAITSDEERRAVAIFAHQVDNGPRRAKHIEKFREGESTLRDYQRARIEAAIREDWDDWYLRQRFDMALYEGIDPAKVREWRRHR